MKMNDEAMALSENPDQNLFRLGLNRTVLGAPIGIRTRHIDLTDSLMPKTHDCMARNPAPVQMHH